MSLGVFDLTNAKYEYTTYLLNCSVFRRNRNARRRRNRIFDSAHRGRSCRYFSGKPVGVCDSGGIEALLDHA